MNEKQELQNNSRTGAEKKNYTVQHFYGERKPLELFVRITVNNFVRNSEEKTLDKNA